MRKLPGEMWRLTTKKKEKRNGWWLLQLLPLLMMMTRWFLSTEKEFVIGHRRKYGNAFIVFTHFLFGHFGHRDRGRFCVVYASRARRQNLRNDFCQSITGLRSATRARYILDFDVHSFIHWNENPNMANGNSFILSVKRIIRHKCHPHPCDNAINCKQIDAWIRAPLNSLNSAI